MGHDDTKSEKLFHHLVKLEVVSYLFIEQYFLLAVWITLIDGGRTNTLSVYVHGEVNWWCCANIELRKRKELQKWKQKYSRKLSAVDLTSDLACFQQRP